MGTMPSPLPNREIKRNQIVVVLFANLDSVRIYNGHGRLCIAPSRSARNKG